MLFHVYVVRFRLLDQAHGVHQLSVCSRRRDPDSFMVCPGSQSPALGLLPSGRAANVTQVTHPLGCADSVSPLPRSLLVPRPRALLFRKVPIFYLPDLQRGVRKGEADIQVSIGEFVAKANCKELERTVGGMSGAACWDLLLLLIHRKSLRVEGRKVRGRSQ